MLNAKQPQPIFTGLLDDKRPQALVEKDFKAEEVLDMGSTVAWVEKDEDELKMYPIWHQNGSGACVAFSFAKVIAIEIFRITGVWVDLSAAFFYQGRSNKNSAGMNTYNACELSVNRGTTLEALMPSQQLSEAEINAVPTSDFAEAVAKAVADAVGSYLYIPNGNMDAVAKVLDMGKAVTVSIFADSGEYRGKEVPVIKNKKLQRADAAIKHKVTIVDYFLHPRYGKVFLVEDSWGVDKADGGRRLFTEEWFKARVSNIVYFDKFSFDSSVRKPQHTFNKNLSRHTTYQTDYEVVMLQNCLKYEGVFPSNVDSTGYYGRITELAVKDFQAKYGIEQVGVVGPITRAKLNSIFS